MYRETTARDVAILINEMNVFRDNSPFLQADAKSEPSSCKSAVALSKDVELLQKELVNLNLEKVLGTEVLANIADPNGSLQK